LKGRLYWGGLSTGCLEGVGRHLESDVVAGDEVSREEGFEPSTF